MAFPGRYGSPRSLYEGRPGCRQPFTVPLAGAGGVLPWPGTEVTASLGEAIGFTVVCRGGGRGRSATEVYSHQL